MNHTPTWAVLPKSVLLLLQLKRLGWELQTDKRTLDIHLTPDCEDHFPATYSLNQRMMLQRDLSQLDKPLTLEMRDNSRLLTDCLVLSEVSGCKILRLGGHYGYFQSEAFIVNFLEQLQLELDSKLPSFDERNACHFFAVYDRIVAGFFTCNSVKN
jgi:hypothetical protein